MNKLQRSLQERSMAIALELLVFMRDSPPTMEK